jgi:MFS transporter, Spinster family, sphingosine-1-phosphate transporter
MTDSSAPTSRPAAAGATFALIVLTLMNLLNYVDRWVPSAVKELFKKDLNLTDAETSFPLSAFIFVYMIASPIFGALAERRSRKLLIALGVAAWSLATAAAAFATGFTSFLIARALVGIGEAAYASLAPTLLADFYPPEKRNKIFTYFYIATPVGSALGFVLGGYLGEHFGWRTAFLSVGLPGLLIAGLALFIKEPARGAFDAMPVTQVSWGEAFKSLAKNKIYLFTVAGYTLVTFATGGIADWFPTFLSRIRGMALSEASMAVGASAVIGGLVGTGFGGALADRLKNYTKNAYLAASGLAMIPAVILITISLYVMRAPAGIIGAIIAAQVFVWVYNAPVNALIVNNVEPGMRARAVGLSILCIHLLGDVISPPLIGMISDATGNLELAMILVPVTALLGGIVWIVGWRKIPTVET